MVIRRMEVMGKMRLRLEKVVCVEHMTADGDWWIERRYQNSHAPGTCEIRLGDDANGDLQEWRRSEQRRTAF